MLRRRPAIELLGGGNAVPTKGAGGRRAGDVLSHDQEARGRRGDARCQSVELRAPLRPASGGCRGKKVGKWRVGPCVVVAGPGSAPARGLRRGH